MSEVKHQYRRPAWVCLACDEPWPCEARRRSFLATYATRKMQLRGVLGALLMDATIDMPTVPVGELYLRFVAWSYRP